MLNEKEYELDSEFFEQIEAIIENEIKENDNQFNFDNNSKLNLKIR